MVVTGASKLGSILWAVRSLSAPASAARREEPRLWEGGWLSPGHISLEMGARVQHRYCRLLQGAGHGALEGSLAYNCLGLGLGPQASQGQSGHSSHRPPSGQGSPGHGV